LIEDKLDKVKQKQNVSVSDSQENETFVWNVFHILNALNMPRKSKDLNKFFIPLPSQTKDSKEKRTQKSKEGTSSSRKRKRTKETSKEKKLTALAAHRYNIFFSHHHFSFLSPPHSKHNSSFFHLFSLFVFISFPVMFLRSVG
jgi:cation transport ATPase